MKIFWKMEHLLQKNKCSIFHNIFKYMIFQTCQRCQKALSLGKGLKCMCMTIMPRSHINGSPRRFYYGLNLTDDPGNANFRSPIRMHYIRMIRYYYVWLLMQQGKLRTNTDCHEWCLIVSVANAASSLWMCDLGMTGGCRNLLTTFVFESVKRKSRLS